MQQTLLGHQLYAEPRATSWRSRNGRDAALGPEGWGIGRRQDVEGPTCHWAFIQPASPSVSVGSEDIVVNAADALAWPAGSVQSRALWACRAQGLTGHLSLRRVTNAGMREVHGDPEEEQLTQPRGNLRDGQLEAVALSRVLKEESLAT